MLFASEREHCVHSFFPFLSFYTFQEWELKVKRKANLVKFWASCHIQPRSMDHCLCPPTRLYFACIYLRGTGSVDSAITGFRPWSCTPPWTHQGWIIQHLSVRIKDTGRVSDSHLLQIFSMQYYQAIFFLNIGCKSILLFSINMV